MLLCQGLRGPAECVSCPWQISHADDRSEGTDGAGQPVRKSQVHLTPSTTSRRAPIPYDRDAYKARNLVERLWCRLKDWRRIATRYDKLAGNFLAAALIAATLIYWCN